MPTTWLAILEARAAEWEVYTDDREVLGDEWPAVLLRRLSNEAWCRRVFAATAAGRPLAEMGVVAS